MNNQQFISFDTQKFNFANEKTPLNDNSEVKIEFNTHNSGA